MTMRKMLLAAAVLLCLGIGAGYAENEKAPATDALQAGVSYASGLSARENLAPHGLYKVECIGPDGKVKWSEHIHNVVTTVGKNVALDAYLGGSSYTVVGPYVGLISSVSYAAGPVVGDTMASHAGWLEAGTANAPTYTAPRKTAVWSAASAGAKALSSSLSFAITSTGTVKGMFIVFGTGALTTIDNAGGTLYSAGVFSGGDKVVSNGDTLNVGYTASL